MGNYKLSKVAQEDLIRIHQYGVRRFGEAQADTYYFALFEQFETIVRESYLFQEVDYIRKGYRRCVCGVESIYYQINDDTIEIMAIIGRQKIEGRF